MRRLGNVALATVIAFAILGIAQAQTQATAANTASIDSPLQTTSRTLQASLGRISRGSALWREAFAAVRGTGRRALVVTTDDDMIFDGANDADREAFNDGVLAEAIPVLRGASRISMVVVVVNLSLVQRIHDIRLSVPREFESDLDRILVHEIYGHALPYLLAGDLSGRCADPKPGERASEACSIRRENAVRAELDLGRRADPGLYSLTLARGRTF
jgi:hypothetical protein